MSGIGPQPRVAKRSTRAGVGCNATGVVTSKCGEKTGTHCHQDVLAVLRTGAFSLDASFALLGQRRPALAEPSLQNRVQLWQLCLYLCVLFAPFTSHQQARERKRVRRMSPPKGSWKSGKRETQFPGFSPHDGEVQPRKIQSAGRK